MKNFSFIAQRIIPIVGSALPLAFCLLLLFPGVSEAQAILLRSNPAANSVVDLAPTEIRMWFTDPLNATYSTARVFRGSGQRVDQNNARVNPGDRTELDVYVPPNLPSATYVVQWRTQSANDGHILLGSFSFTVANADGSIQKLTGVLPGQGQLGSGVSDGITGQLSGTSLFDFILATLVTLGILLWVGAQLWRAFVSQLTEEQDEKQKILLREAEQRFDRLLSLPTLILIFVANIGILVNQALILTHGQLAAALSPSRLSSLLSGSLFGTYWTMFQVALLLAILLAVYTIVVKRRFPAFDEFFSWANLLLGLALLIVLALLDQTFTTGGSFSVLAVLLDWLQLFAASLWVGGIFYIATAYLPLVIHAPLRERIGSLLSVLPRYSFLAIAGILLIVITGPIDASLHMTPSQLFTTAYGRVLIVKGILVVALLLTTLYTLSIARPKLAQDLLTFDTQADSEEVEHSEYGEHGEDRERTQQDEPLKSTSASTAKKMVTSEGIIQQTRQLIDVLRFVPLLGVAIVLCSVLLTTFAGTLIPVPVSTQAAQNTQTTPTPSASTFTQTAQTTDKHYTLTFSVTPNQTGNNQFTVNVKNSNGQSDNMVSVSLFTTMLDMDMGTNDITMQSTGQGDFKGSGELGMSGHWQIRIDVRTPTGSVSHATIDFQNASPNI